MRAARFFLAIAVLSSCSRIEPAASPERASVPKGPQSVAVDLATDTGASQVGAQWRFTEARIVPSGSAFDIQPKAGGKTFDDSRWQLIDPESLTAGRGAGKLSFCWYRVTITLPESVGALRVLGSQVEFETVVDDYAEVWVNGELPRNLGQKGGSLIAGFNAPNRLLLTKSAKPGEKFVIAIFGINGPLSDPPANKVFLRSAKLLFSKAP